MVQAPDRGFAVNTHIVTQPDAAYVLCAYPAITCALVVLGAARVIRDVGKVFAFLRLAWFTAFALVQRTPQK